MKIFILSIIYLSTISSIVCAVPPTLRVALLEAREGIEFMVRRNMGTLRVTPGFKPEKQTEIPKEFISHREFPRKVKFLDGDHSLFIVPGDKRQTTTTEAPQVTRENDHSVRVDLKKK